MAGGSCVVIWIAEDKTSKHVEIIPNPDTGELLTLMTPAPYERTICAREPYLTRQFGNVGTQGCFTMGSDTGMFSVSRERREITL